MCWWFKLTENRSFEMCNQRQKPTKGDLLEKYADVSPRQLLQYDGYSDVCYEFANYDLQYMDPDKEGDALCKAETFELIPEAINVRVYIRPDIKKKDVLRLLKKIYKNINRNGFIEVSEYIERQDEEW
jgi:hypothetical protein